MDENTRLTLLAAAVCASKPETLISGIEMFGDYTIVSIRVAGATFEVHVAMLQINGQDLNVRAFQLTDQQRKSVDFLESHGFPFEIIHNGERHLCASLLVKGNQSQESNRPRDYPSAYLSLGYIDS